MTTEREMDAAYQRYLDEQERHGECSLARCVRGDVDCPVGLILECWECGTWRQPVMRRAVKLGPVVNRAADPTQSYVLACGHTTI